MHLTPNQNIILIGMPGCGKSTVGVLLAKALGRGFVDTDLLLQAHSGHLLQQIVDQDGICLLYTSFSLPVCTIQANRTEPPRETTLVCLGLSNTFWAVCRVSPAWMVTKSTPRCV